MPRPGHFSAVGFETKTCRVQVVSLGRLGTCKCACCLPIHGMGMARQDQRYRSVLKLGGDDTAKTFVNRSSETPLGLVA